MSEGRYNIPKQYKVDKGMPLDALFQKIDNLKCRRIFETEIESVEWSYHLVDKGGIKDMRELVREQGLSVFEVNLKRKIDPDLLTDVFSGLLQRPILMVYLCNGELSMGTYIPIGKSSRTCSTDFYPYDADRLIEVMDYDADSGKTTQQIHKRIYAMLFHQKRMIMIEKAFEQLNKDNEKESFAFEFSLENLDRIRADADFVQSQLKVV
ncbi:MAG: hypothetical protein K2G55_00500 [Lachnospiraceae bacterium]|nr:hypothetical protein [Lachnospiraceae bacterium]MDE7204642.1 hypothetical protein [Lachnospiraceae bacterium]